MDIDRLTKIIDSDLKLKNDLFFNYIKEDLDKWSSDYITYFLEDNKITFLNKQTFNLSYEKSLEGLIEEFNSNMSIYENYIKEINNTLNVNINDLINELNIFINEQLKLYHLHKLIDIKFRQFSNYVINLSLDLYIDDKFIHSLSLNLYDIYINKININDIKIKLGNFIKEHSIQFVLNTMKKYVPNMRYKLQISTDATDVSNPSNLTIKEGWETYITIPIDIIYNKQLYNIIEYELKNYIESLKYKRYIYNLKNNLKFEETHEISEYDLVNGKINPNFDLNKFDNIKHLYNDIIKFEKEYEKLRHTINEQDMYFFEFMGRIKVFKDKEIEKDGHKYVVYKNKVKRKSHNLIIFKDGKRVGRKNFYREKKLIGYYRKVTINPNNTDEKYWEHISRMPISEKQIEEFSDKLNWVYISKYRPLSDNMLLKYKDKIDWINILDSRKINGNVLKEISKSLGWSIISRYARMSDKFVNNNLDKLDIGELLKNKYCSHLLDIANKLSKN